MSKRGLCTDLRAEGKEPACVTACPSRALDWGPIDVLRDKYGDISAVAPLPDPSITKPNLVIRPHRDAKEWDTNHGEIMNRQEI